jgi:hypothetical protein
MQKSSILRVRGVRLVPLFAVLGAVLCIALPQSAVSADFVKGVRGYIYDSLSNPIEGANVTVVVKDTGGSTTATYYFDGGSLSNGYYQVTVAQNEWDVGYTIEVTARFDSSEKTETVVADDMPFQDVDVTLPIAIPEFGGILGSSVGFIVVVIIAMFIVFRRKRA